MSNIVFVALVKGDHVAGYQATFPDVADCAAQGRDLSELLVNAREALAACLSAIENAGDAWPAATPIEQISVTPGSMPIPVDVAVDDPPVRVNISLGERLLQRLDAAAGTRGMTRSGFIAQSVRMSLGETARPGGDFDAVGRRLQDELTALGRRINELDGVVYDGVRKAADTVSAAMLRRRAASRPAGRAKDQAEAL